MALQPRRAATVSLDSWHNQLERFVLARRATAPSVTGCAAKQRAELLDPELSDREWKKLMLDSTEVTFKPDQVLIAQDSKHQHLFRIERGTARVVKEQENQRPVLLKCAEAAEGGLTLCWQHRYGWRHAGRTERARSVHGVDGGGHCQRSGHCAPVRHSARVVAVRCACVVCAAALNTRARVERTVAMSQVFSYRGFVAGRAPGLA